MATPVDLAPDRAPPTVHPAGAVSGRVTLARRLTRRSSWPAWANLVAVLGVTLVALSQLHPSLLLANTTTAGGDTGAHVILPAFLKSHLLNHGQLTGWDPDWYDGFPLYTFYFPLPGVITVLFNAVVPYNVAFKFVTVLGTLTLPVCAWAFGRLAGLRDPGPACLAAATLPFLFEPSFSIYGGNILSTLAGEFSFSLSLSVALLFLGVVAFGPPHRPAPGTGRRALRRHPALPPAARPVRRGRRRRAGSCSTPMWSEACAAASAGRLARRRWSRRLLVVGGRRRHRRRAHRLVAGALRHRAGVHDQHGLHQGARASPTCSSRARPAGCWPPTLVGLVAMVVRRNRVALFIAVMAGISAAAVCLDPANKLYNARFLPFWFLCLYLMAGYALAESVAGRGPLEPPPPARPVGVGGPGAPGAVRGHAVAAR